MVSLYAVLVSSVAVVTLLQPVTAGPAIGAAAAGLTGVEIGKNLKVRGTTPLRRDDYSTRLGACMGSSITSNPPTLFVNADKTVTINGIPPTCMAEITAYNAESNIADLNAVHGTVTVINGTAIEISGLTSGFVAYLESVAKKEN